MQPSADESGVPQTMKLNNRIWHLTVALAPFAAFALTLVAGRRWF